MKILIYSFDRFQNLESNPAYEVGKEIFKKFNSKDVDLIQLPVTYNCWEMLKNKIMEFRPDFILGIGVAVSINSVKLEKIGLNYKHAEIPDNEDKKIILEKIDDSKNLSYDTSIDVLNFASKLKENGIPAEISFSAGTYVCNYTYYNCLQYLANTDAKILFIHVPVSPKEAITLNTSVACFPTDLIANGLFKILKAL